MPKIISGLRVARSFVTPSGVAVVSRELDFQLGANQGISIQAVLGYGLGHDDTPTPSDTAPVPVSAIQTLHLETGAIEDIPLVGGEDEDDIDTEIFYAQMFGSQFIVGNTATFGAGGWGVVTPSGLVTFAEPILTARNITHSAKTEATGQLLDCGVLIYYKYVLFSGSELGFLLARRQ